MDALNVSAATDIARFLTDERDIAALRRTNHFFNALYSNNPGLWSCLIQQRFGPQAAAGEQAAGGAVEGGAAAAAPADPEQRFRQLAQAATRRPAADLECIIWLNNQYLERIEDPTSTYGQAIRVNYVWWLELSGRFRGILPGVYRVAWRIRLQPDYQFDGVRLGVRLEPGATAVGLNEGEEQPVTETEFNYEAIRARAQQANGRWFDLVSAPAQVTAQLCNLWTELNGKNNSFKQGIVINSVRLLHVA